MRRNHLLRGSVLAVPLALILAGCGGTAAPVSTASGGTAASTGGAAVTSSAAAAATGSARASASAPAAANGSTAPSAKSAATGSATTAPAPSAVASSAAGGDVVKLGVLGYDAPEIIGEADGLFAKQGLKIQDVRFATGNESLPQLGAGNIDATGSGVNVALFNIVSRGVKIKIVNSGSILDKTSKYAGLLIRKDLAQSGAIKSPADLKGRTVSLSAAGGSGDFALAQLLQKHGLTIKDVSVQILTYANQPLGFANKAIDASVTIEPYLTTITSSGDATVLSNFGDELDPMQFSVLSYSADFATKRQAVAQKFATAYLQAEREYSDAFERGINKDHIVTVLAQAEKLKPADVAKSFPTTYSRSGEVLIDSLKRQQAYFQSSGVLQKPVDIDSLVDNSFMVQANKELGA